MTVIPCALGLEMMAMAMRSALRLPSLVLPAA
jgi:hypothetical protein